MESTRTGTAALLGLLAAGAVAVAPAGKSEPFQVRTVTMEGHSGPAYYSPAAGRYRFLAAVTPGEMAALAAAR